MGVHNGMKISQKNSISNYQAWCSRKTDICTLEHMANYMPNTKSESQYQIGDEVKYRCRNGDVHYKISALPAKKARDVHCSFVHNGKEYEFKPHLHPQKMLEMGVFEGKMINDCMDEFPREWFKQAIVEHKLSPDRSDPSCNKYGVKARSSLREWKRKNWIIGEDPRGWFQWYCRYCLGRRMPDVDSEQMKRWWNIRRFKGMQKRFPNSMKIRQNLLQWSWPQK